MTIRKSEHETLIENLKKGFNELIQNRAEELIESDDEALADIREQEAMNCDCGGGWDYNEINTHITDRLEEEAETELLNILSDELGEKSSLYKTLVYIHESSLAND